MATPNQIAKAHVTARPETVADAVSRANRWSTALIEAGFETALKNEYCGFDGQAVIVGDNPTSESELCAIEEALGFALPPSYRRFLGDAGSLTFLNYWWDETTPSISLVDEAKTWRQEVKDKLVRVEAMQPAIEPDELYTCLHGIRRAIKSNKLRERRESLLVALRRDGQAANAKLPALDRRSPQSDAPKSTGLFGTFDEWLASVVDAIIEDVTAALSSEA